MHHLARSILADLFKVGFASCSRLSEQALRIEHHLPDPGRGSFHEHIKLIIDVKLYFPPGHFHSDLRIAGTHFSGNRSGC